MTELEAFAQDLRQDVVSEAELEGAEAFLEQAFTSLCLSRLGEAGELEDPEVCLHRNKVLGLQLSGFAVSEEGDSMDLAVTVHTNEVPPRTILKSEMADAFRRVTKFFDQSRGEYFRSIEEATGAFDVARQIYEQRSEVTRVRFLLLTDGVCKSDPPASKSLGHIQATFDVWDIERLFRDWSSGRERQEIEIDLTDLVGHPLPCLVQENAEGGYATYLSIFPGSLVKELYGRYGPRLLERNVRSFLQMKGGINNGIRQTIRQTPSMFLAYNNGLSCTAASVVLDDLGNGAKGLHSVRDLQIVNGGQTTASIFHVAMKDKADISGIGVQVKLTILDDPDRMDEVVPRISKYANSQNQVTTADLRANDKYHRRVEELSRTIWAPAQDGTLRQTRWFYERARGQYRDDLARERTPARRRDFEATSPKRQVITKTDLAKVLLTYDQKPHVVSKGAQYAFSAFTVQVDKHVEADGPVNQEYFERLVAKTVLFRDTDRLVKQAKYPGYGANIVTYTIAKLVFIAGSGIDLGRIWRDQGIYPELESAIRKIAEACYRHIIDGASGGNVTQYCKKEQCWNSFRDLYVSIPHATAQSLESVRRVGSADPVVGGTSARRDSDPVVAEAAAMSSLTWIRAASFTSEQRLFSPKQVEVLTSLGLTLGEGKMPSKKTAEIGLSLLTTARAQGFTD